MKPTLAAVLLTLLLAQPVQAGNEMGNGSDHFSSDFGAAWFVGAERIVKFCLDPAPDFPRTLPELRADVEWAWEKWMVYIDVKGLHTSVESPQFRFPRQLREVPCSGTEDLRLRFGTEDQEVREIRSKYQRPTAIAHRERFNEESGWGKGWIWFSAAGAVDHERDFPKWRNSALFRAVLLHELGHVLGNLHVSGTIMDRSLSERLLREGASADPKIDGSRELLTTGTRLPTVPGRLGSFGYYNSMRVFEWALGRRPAGAVKAQLSSGERLGELVLNISDSQGSIRLPLRVTPSGYAPRYETDVPVFKRIRGSLSHASYSGGGVSYGQIEHPQHGTLLAFFETNMSSALGGAPFSIQVFHDGHPMPLFMSEPQY